ncbi:hypothetical protein UXN85_20580 [Enterobacter hormaechei]
MIKSDDHAPAKKSGREKVSAPKKRANPRTARDPQGKGRGAGARTKAPDEGAGGNEGNTGTVINLASRKERIDKGKPDKPKQDRGWKAGASAVIDDAKRAAGIPTGDDPQPTIRRLRTGINQKLDIYDVDQAVKDIKAEGFLDSLNMDLLITAIARRNLLDNTMKIATTELSIMIDCYNGLITPDDPRYVELGKDAKHPIFQFGKSISDAHYAMSDCLKTIAHLSQGTRKAKTESQKQTQEQTTSQLTAEVYEKLAEGELSALDAVMQLEAHGAKPPSFLLSMANKELTEEPPVDPSATSAVDQEQLDKEARLYASMKEGKEAFLEERRKAVSGIVDRGGYGDIDENGQRREGEGLGEYDEEELDVEATQDQYLDEDGEDWGDD